MDRVEMESEVVGGGGHFPGADEAAGDEGGIQGRVRREAKVVHHGSGRSSFPWIGR